MFNIYQTIMTNFGTTVYTGQASHEAAQAAEKSGFECTILRDGSFVGSYSPISGWKFF
jgi:hypothetical protein